MPGRLAVDFGTSNTMVAVWDDARQEGKSVHLPALTSSREAENGDQIHIIPSLIHYGPQGERWIGNQVVEKDLCESNQTFRWMKSYISRRSPFKKRVHGRQISHNEAGRDFLSGVLLVATEELDVGAEEIAFTVPVEAFEDYENWLAEVAESAGMKGFRLIDEPSAAALGYGAGILPDDIYLIFDFGGGTLDVAIVRVEDDEKSSDTGRRCRVLGKAGSELGGATIDQWLFERVLRQTGRTDTDDDVRAVSSMLLVMCERAKERLSFHEDADITVAGHEGGPEISTKLTRNDFDNILEEHETFSLIDRTIRRALNDAREKGYTEDDIDTVMMVGGSSQIPAVQKAVQRFFGKDRVKLDRPLDAVARGAAAFVAGTDFFDYIQHDYALRHLNKTRDGYEYRPIVTRGTPYPTEEPIAHLTVKASHDGQTQLGLVLFETGQRVRDGSVSTVEIGFDPSGAARLMSVTPEEKKERSCFQIGSPTFLTAEPPAQQGEARFDVSFKIDANKRLLVSVRDLKMKRWMQKDYPMVRLT